MENKRIPRVAFKWTPGINGKRTRGRPKTTWRRTMKTDLKINLAFLVEGPKLLLEPEEDRLAYWSLLLRQRRSETLSK